MSQQQANQGKIGLENQQYPTNTGFFSENGHTLSRIEPMTTHSGASVASFFNGLFATIVGISTLGTSVTFSYVLSSNVQAPRALNPTFSLDEIHSFLAVSWLLFLLAMAFGSLGSTLLTFYKKRWVADWDGYNGRTSRWAVQMYAVTASAFMGGLVIGAFIILGLVVVAYSPTVGWIAVGVTSFFGLIIMLAVLKQAPWPWRD
ncbi:hypothetical protein PV10_03390 [Exophiala mesophila]|uniref:Uncharacterized protein n=1 Tax=Exophiala mesophila TaxID=212818 RepID=A0A0D1X1X1_EXOME|nr:uncharacterized protein PV10_03390 [Exophiala mesophila]KIV95775.1 hypothetical protein PV10_03390 [Exophiala mesophila]